MVFKNFFSRYLFLTNSVIFSGLFGLGDFIEQQLQRHKEKKKCQKIKPYDFSRTIRMATVGAVMSPANHFWYVALDRVITGKIHSMVFRKVLADEIIMSPICAIGFIGGMAKLEGHHFEESWNEVKMMFWPIYKMDLTVWPAAQALNFYIVPPQYRVLYVSFVTLIWNIFLSYIKHDTKESEKNINVKEAEAYPNVNLAE